MDLLTLVRRCITTVYKDEEIIVKHYPFDYSLFLPCLNTLQKRINL
jgi:hypothetical protein